MPGKWKDAELALLGTMEDRHVAYIIDRTPHAVAARRMKMRIPMCYHTPTVIREYAEALPVQRELDLKDFLHETRRSYRRIVKHQHLFGSMPDVELAKILGVSRTQVTNVRQRNGIPAYCPAMRVHFLKCEFCGCVIPLIGTHATSLRTCMSETCKRRRRLKYGTRYRASKQLRVATRTLEKIYEQSCIG